MTRLSMFQATGATLKEFSDYRYAVLLALTQNLRACNIQITASLCSAKPMMMQNTKGLMCANHPFIFLQLHALVLLNSSPTSSLHGSEVLRKSEFSSTWRTLESARVYSACASLHFECHFRDLSRPCDSKGNCFAQGVGICEERCQVYLLSHGVPTTITKSLLALESFIHTVFCNRLNFSLGCPSWSLDAAFFSFIVVDGLYSYWLIPGKPFYAKPKPWRAFALTSIN